MDNLDRLISIIIYADIVGYSSMMQGNEQLALSKLKHFEDVLKIQSKKYDGGAEFDAILHIRCLLPGNHSTPPSWVEGIRITVQNALNFNKTVPGGGTLFLDLN